jgi:hypothetical protein
MASQRSLRPQEDQGQLARLGLRERLDGQLAVGDLGGFAGERFPQLVQKRAALGVLGADTADEEQQRRLGRSDQV